MKLTAVILDQEEWREVPSQPSLLASSWGRIWKKPCEAKMPHGGMREYAAKPTFGVTRKATKHARHSYKGYTYRGIGNVKVHRLVCEAFHGPPPFQSAVVIHINEDSYDNRPCNLQWGTQKENLNGQMFLEYCRSRRGDASPTVKGRRKRTA